MVYAGVAERFGMYVDFLFSLIDSNLILTNFFNSTSSAESLLRRALFEL